MFSLIVLQIYLCVFVCVWSVQNVSSHVIQKIETFIEEDIRNIVHRTVIPQPPLK